MGRIFFKIIHFVIYECGPNVVLDLQGFKITNFYNILVCLIIKMRQYITKFLKIYNKTRKINLFGRKGIKKTNADNFKVLDLPCKLTNQNPVEPFVMRMERGLMRQG